jgi:sulfur carrier protein ThiS
MQILFINNDGAGFADYLNVQNGVTVSQFFGKQLPDRRPEDYLIRVNRQPVPQDYILHEGDRVSMTPTKISGAFSDAA